MRLVCFLLSISLLLLLFCACAAEKGSGSDGESGQLAQENQEDRPASQVLADFDLSEEERTALIGKSFRFLFDIDFTRYSISPMENVADIAEQTQVWKSMAGDIPAFAEGAYREACETRGEQPGDFICEPPDWKMLGTLYYRFGTGMADLLCDYGEVNVSLRAGKMDLSLDFGDFDALMQGVQEEGAFGARLSYAYLNTVYDMDGQETAYVHAELDEAYLKALHDPLPGHKIKDGWYNDRDKGARKHTGTDIKAAEDTPILSCTSGIVQHIGTNPSAGNYLVVRDEQGFMYHYYHMVRLTDFLKAGDRVSAGDVIGHVGNTGNSSANHLHLSVISPDYRYLNPYLMLRDMRELQQ